MAFVYWYIRDFFLFICNIIVFIFDLIWSIITVLIGAVEFMTSVISSLPVVITVSMSALVIICVLYKVLGRESSG